MTKLAFNFTHYDLREQRAGVTIEVTLSVVANVRLMTERNFSLYKQVQKHQFIGGVARKSPIRIVIPQTAHWHLVVDMEGHHGNCESKLRIVQPVAKPQFQPAPAATRNR